MARWDLGGSAMRMDDQALLDVTKSVLPREADLTTDPVKINGHSFDPLHPTAGYQR